MCCNRWKRASGKSSSTAAATPDTPPSGHLVYIRNGTLLAVPFDLKRLETSGPPVPVLEGVQETDIGAGQFSLANNGSLVYVPGADSGDATTLVWVDRNGAAEPLKALPRAYRLPRLSPDGQQVALIIAERMQPFPGPGGKHQISTEGAREIVWAANGELFYRTGDKMMAVEIKTQPSLIVGKPRLLFEGYAVNQTVGAVAANYDVTPDGQRFIMLQPSAQPAAGTQIVVVENWLEELKRRVPPR